MHTFESSQLQGKNDLNSTTENVHAFLDDQGHCTCQSVGAGVPELDIRRVEPNSDMLAIWSPVDACDGTAVIVDDQKLRRGPTGASHRFTVSPRAMDSKLLPPQSSRLRY